MAAVYWDAQHIDEGVRFLKQHARHSGTGSAPNGACDEHREGGDDVSLHAAMSAQPAYGDSFNEVILGSLDWQEALPRIIAAVVVTRSRGVVVLPMLTASARPLQSTLVRNCRSSPTAL